MNGWSSRPGDNWDDEPAWVYEITWEWEPVPGQRYPGDPGRRKAVHTPVYEASRGIPAPASAAPVSPSGRATVPASAPPDQNQSWSEQTRPEQRGPAGPPQRDEPSWNRPDTMHHQMPGGAPEQRHGPSGSGWSRGPQQPGGFGNRPVSPGSAGRVSPGSAGHVSPGSAGHGGYGPGQDPDGRTPHGGPGSRGGATPPGGHPGPSGGPGGPGRHEAAPGRHEGHPGRHEQGAPGRSGGGPIPPAGYAPGWAGSEQDPAYQGRRHVPEQQGPRQGGETRPVSGPPPQGQAYGAARSAPADAFPAYPDGRRATRDSRTPDAPFDLRPAPQDRNSPPPSRPAAQPTRVTPQQPVTPPSAIYPAVPGQAPGRPVPVHGHGTAGGAAPVSGPATPFVPGTPGSPRTPAGTGVPGHAAPDHIAPGPAPHGTQFPPGRPASETTQALRAPGPGPHAAPGVSPVSAPADIRRQTAPGVTPVSGTAGHGPYPQYESPEITQALEVPGAAPYSAPQATAVPGQYPSPDSSGPGVSFPAGQGRAGDGVPGGHHYDHEQEPTRPLDLRRLGQAASPHGRGDSVTDPDEPTRPFGLRRSGAETAGRAHDPRKTDRRPGPPAEHPAEAAGPHSPGGSLPAPYGAEQAATLPHVAGTPLAVAHTTATPAAGSHAAAGHAAGVDDRGSAAEPRHAGTGVQNRPGERSEAAGPHGTGGWAPGADTGPVTPPEAPAAEVRESATAPVTGPPATAGPAGEESGTHGLGWLLSMSGLGATTPVPAPEPAAPVETVVVPEARPLGWFAPADPDDIPLEADDTSAGLTWTENNTSPAPAGDGIAGTDTAQTAHDTDSAQAQPHTGGTDFVTGEGLPAQRDPAPSRDVPAPPGLVPAEPMPVLDEAGGDSSRPGQTAAGEDGAFAGPAHDSWPPRGEHAQSDRWDPGPEDSQPEPEDAGDDHPADGAHDQPPMADVQDRWPVEGEVSHYETDVPHGGDAAPEPAEDAPDSAWQAGCQPSADTVPGTEIHSPITHTRAEATAAGAGPRGHHDEAPDEAGSAAEHAEAMHVDLTEQPAAADMPSGEPERFDEAALSGEARGDAAADFDGPEDAFREYGYEESGSTSESVEAERLPETEPSYDEVPRFVGDFVTGELSAAEPELFLTATAVSHSEQNVVPAGTGNRPDGSPEDVVADQPGAAGVRYDEADPAGPDGHEAAPHDGTDDHDEAGGHDGESVTGEHGRTSEEHTGHLPTGETPQASGAQEVAEEWAAVTAEPSRVEPAGAGGIGTEPAEALAGDAEADGTQARETEAVAGRDPASTAVAGPADDDELPARVTAENMFEPAAGDTVLDPAPGEAVAEHAVTEADAGSGRTAEPDETASAGEPAPDGETGETGAVDEVDSDAASDHAGFDDATAERDGAEGERQEPSATVDAGDLGSADVEDESGTAVAETGTVAGASTTGNDADGSESEAEAATTGPSDVETTGPAEALTAETAAPAEAPQTAAQACEAVEPQSDETVEPQADDAIAAARADDAIAAQQTGESAETGDMTPSAGVLGSAVPDQVAGGIEPAVAGSSEYVAGAGEDRASDVPAQGPAPDAEAGGAAATSGEAESRKAEPEAKAEPVRQRRDQRAPADRRRADPEQILAAYPWTYDPRTLREQVDEPDRLWDVADRLTDRLEFAERDNVRAGLLGLRAVVHRILGELDDALADGQEALRHAEAGGELRTVAVAQARLAHVLQWRGEFDEADRLYARTDSVELPTRLRAEISELAGRSAFEQGRYLEAVNHFERALNVRRGEDPELVERVELALDAISRRSSDGWGPYPRGRDELLGLPEAPVPLLDDGAGLWGYAAAVEPRYAEAQPFAEGLAWVRKPDSPAWELIDHHGELVIPAAHGYLGVGRFAEGLAWVTRQGDGDWFAIDRQNQLVVPSGGYDEARPFRRGLALVRQGGVWGAVDRRAQIAVPPRFRQFATVLYIGGAVDGFTDEGLAVVDAGDRFGVLDRTGRLVVAAVHAAVVIHPSAFLVRDAAGLWGALDRGGEPLVDLGHRDAASVVEQLPVESRPVL